MFVTFSIVRGSILFILINSCLYPYTEIDNVFPERDTGASSHGLVLSLCELLGIKLGEIQLSPVKITNQLKTIFILILNFLKLLETCACALGIDVPAWY